MKFSAADNVNFGTSEEHHKRRVALFMSRTARDESTGCLNWIGPKGKTGRPAFSFRAGKWVAARVSYVWFRGEIPEGMLVCHTCDNPMCVEPSHLFLGTHADNVADMWRKGRSRLQKAGIGPSVEQVKEIKLLASQGIKPSEIAKRVPISSTTIWRIATGRSHRAI